MTQCITEGKKQSIHFCKLCVCVSVHAWECERREVYKLTGCTNIDFTIDINTILNTSYCGIVRNLREKITFLRFKYHIPLCKSVYTFTEHTVTQQHYWD